MPTCYGEYQLQYLQKLCIIQNITKGNFHLTVGKKLQGGVQGYGYPYHVALLHSTLTAFSTELSVYILLQGHYHRKVH
jgi:hypothetical protein